MGENGQFYSNYTLNFAEVHVWVPTILRQVGEQPATDRSATTADAHARQKIGAPVCKGSNR